MLPGRYNVGIITTSAQHVESYGCSKMDVRLVTHGPGEDIAAACK